MQRAAAVTANDVVTAMVAGGMRAWLSTHDELPERSLVAICPVAVSDAGSEGGGQLRNAFGTALCVLVAFPSILPTILLPMLPVDLRLSPGYNLPISNVPGPRSDLYWNGAHLDAMYPASIVYDGMALNVTVCSYADQVGFGFLGGGGAVPDLESLAPLTTQALEELERAVGIAT